MENNDARKTPKEYFLIKFYAALKEFEDMTGVEIHAIRVERIPIDDMGTIKKTIVNFQYDLDLK